VIDGQQRLMSIYYFIKQRFPLKTKRVELRRIYDSEGQIPDRVLYDNAYFSGFQLFALQKAFDPKWESKVPLTMLLSPGGKVLYRVEGELDVLDLRRHILASMPADYPGFQKYWTAP
jgi:hypothetical protein